MTTSTHNFGDLQQEAWEANQALNNAGLVVATFGNASVLDRNAGIFAIKPSGIPYASLKAKDMVLVDLDLNIVTGAYRPSSDTSTHGVLYREFGTIGAICHTHSTHAVAWAQALRSIPVYGTTHADHLTVPVPCTPLMSDARIDGNYEIETGNEIVQYFVDQGLSFEEVEMVLVGGAWSIFVECGRQKSRLQQRYSRRNCPNGTPHGTDQYWCHADQRKLDSKTLATQTRKGRLLRTEISATINEAKPYSNRRVSTLNRAKSTT